MKKKCKKMVAALLAMIVMSLTLSVPVEAAIKKPQIVSVTMRKGQTHYCMERYRG